LVRTRDVAPAVTVAAFASPKIGRIIVRVRPASHKEEHPRARRP
jgi:hypothetical protein